MYRFFSKYCKREVLLIFTLSIVKVKWFRIELESGSYQSSVKQCPVLNVLLATAALKRIIQIVRCSLQEAKACGNLTETMRMITN